VAYTIGITLKIAMLAHHRERQVDEHERGEPGGVDGQQPQDDDRPDDDRHDDRQPAHGRLLARSRED